ncbi:MAG: glycosyltransferase family 4 protein [Bacteroides sp.]|nr:glycosyltransferase family 4 protein [Bacteroides sp.]
MHTPKLYMVVNEDRFFLSHRKPVALAAKEAGFDVVILTKDTGRRAEVEALGFPMVELPINPTGMNLTQELKTFLFLFNLYRKEQPELVHHVGIKNMLWGGLAARLTHIHGIVNAVSGLGGLFNAGKLTAKTRAILKVMKYANSRPKVKVIFQNNDDKSIFLSRRVIVQDQLEFTKGSGIDLKEFAYVPEPEEEVINIIFTARMVREKGVCDLIEAAEMLKPQYQGKIRFLLCGRLTPNKTGITEDYMKEHCDGEYINWLGERNDVKQLLEKSHIMAFPSYYREGVPKSLIEASAIGRPIVTCDSTGCRDVVEDGVNGFLVEPQSPKQIAEALKKLIDDPELRRRMGKKSREFAERDFSIEKVVDTHLRIYRSLAK